MVQKIAQVSVLPAHKLSLLGVNTKNDKFYYFNPVVHNEGKYLYFTIDEEVEEGDHILLRVYSNNEWLFQLIKAKEKHVIDSKVYSERRYKVVATSNPDLWSTIPKISVSFMQAYAKKQGIKEVTLYYYSNPYKDLTELHYGPVLDRDGCVIVQKKKGVKESLGKILDKIFTIR